VTIIGVMLLHNEDLYAGQAVRNIRAFCDEIVVIDNGSTDSTVEEVRAAGVDRIIHEPDLTKTHDHVQDYSGQSCWLFGVDGDELYDPEGLRELRSKIVGNEYGNAYQIKGRYLHVTALSQCREQAVGHLSPPSHNPTKLYNFRNLDWPSDGCHILFQARPRMETGELYSLAQGWDDTMLRCLHLRFLQRSSTEDAAMIGRRLHGEDKLGYGAKKERDGAGGNMRPSYRKGPSVIVDTTPFFRGVT